VTQTIEDVKLADLVPPDKNPRLHNISNMKAIVHSLNRFGQQKPIVINKRNQILAGNGTAEAARALKWETIKAVRSELDGPEALAYLIADNRTVELSEWDYAVLVEDVSALLASGASIDGIGWNEEELKALTEEEWKPPAPGQISEDEPMRPGRSYTLTPAQYEVFARAVIAVREQEQDPELREGAALALMADWYVNENKKTTAKAS
jgi:site-specific DNA-methyltransferase (adenine-specific)